MRNQMRALLGMSEEQMEKAARTGAVPNMMQPKVHKGKGKTKETVVTFKIKMPRE